MEAAGTAAREPVQLGARISYVEEGWAAEIDMPPEVSPYKHFFERQESYSANWEALVQFFIEYFHLLPLQQCSPNT